MVKGTLKRAYKIKNEDQARTDLINIKTDDEAQAWIRNYPDAWKITQKDSLAKEAIKMYVPALAKYL